MSKKFPTAVMMMGVISNEGDFWVKEVRPPSSPECNPLDYYVWGAARGPSTGPPITLWTP